MMMMKCFALPGKLPYQGRGDASCSSKTRSRCPRNSLCKDVGQLRWVYAGGPCPEMPDAVGALLGKSQGAVVTWPLQRCAAGLEKRKSRRRRRKRGGELGEFLSCHCHVEPSSTPVALGSLSLALLGCAGAT